MLAFSGLNGRIYCGDKLQDIKNNHRKNIGKILIADFFVRKNDGNGPPKTKAIDAQQGQL